MKQLPVGVYAVSNLFTAEGAFRFQGEVWQAQPDVTGFHSLEELAKQPLEAVKEPFLGYENVPVILIPKGNMPIGEVGKTNAERFRVVLPRAVRSWAKMPAWMPTTTRAFGTSTTNGTTRPCCRAASISVLWP